LNRSSTVTSAPGTVIGEARVYSFGLTDAAYTGDASTWDLFLFDVQTYTQISVNLALSKNSTFKSLNCSKLFLVKKYLYFNFLLFKI